MTAVDPAELGRRLGGTVTGLTRMTGGASRETWAFDLDGRPLVLRRDPPGSPRAGEMEREAALLRAAYSVGVAVPEVYDAGPDFIVMQRLAGETIARRILRDETFSVARARLVEDAADALARLHTGVRPDDIAGLVADTDPLETLRDQLDGYDEPHPALELGLRQLARNRPASYGTVTVHGDFRLGNWMVGNEGLVGILDWELAHVGDPVEDLGWMCVRSWRFGGDKPVAGVGEREDLLAAYGKAAARDVDPEDLRWWEAVGTLRWGVICVRQAATHLTGAVRSVELAAIGRRVCEVELDLLELLVPDLDIDALVADAAAEFEETGIETAPHDRPSADELLEAIQEWLAGLPLEGRERFLARVTHRGLDLVRRELVLGPVLARRHRRRLAALGVKSDTELAAQIRAGRDDEDLVRAVCAAVVDKLRVADPGQLSDRH